MSSLIAHAGGAEQLGLKEQDIADLVAYLKTQ